MGRSSRWMPVAVTTAVAALLTCAAFVTASQAACDDPGSYVARPGGIVLVGGCLHRDDLPVAPPQDQPPQPAPPAPIGD
ncbi:MAG TPA: hypothetical protein VFQ77_19840 [Pseudonocardiaceae bacterium]|jgi:hypothetical protein|nr:hypothetical protein [Pseudonocardiaceae bacterium]